MTAELIKEGKIRSKWPGLGMSMFSPWDSQILQGRLNILNNNGFKYLRMDIPDWNVSEDISYSKLGVQAAVLIGFKVIWGVSSNGTTLTTSNWSDFTDAVKAAALWAQNNEVYEFQIGNEEDYHVDDITISGDDVPGLMRTLATEVKAIFINGNISCSVGDWSILNRWNTETRGDIDIIAMNVYKGTPVSTTWEDAVDELVSHFGNQHCYITEFNIHNTNISSYSQDEDIQAEATKEMIDYFLSSNIYRAFYFQFNDDGMGCQNDDGSFKEKIWDELKHQKGIYISGNGNITIT